MENRGQSVGLGGADVVGRGAGLELVRVVVVRGPWGHGSVGHRPWECGSWE